MDNRIKQGSRIALLVCSILLAIILFVPIWRIILYAPQYPEGLKLLIYPSRLGGNVEIINGLNHYIGMKKLSADDFVEFKILPYVILFFSILLLVTTISRRKKLLVAAASLFIVFGILAMADFWRWEYDYGHNLNPEAAIKVPGMAYQPPFLGYKQLLNFSAFSIPDIGGWIFLATGIALLVIVFIELFAFKKQYSLHTQTGTVAVLLLLFFAASCNVQPTPFIIGSDRCSYCKMPVSDSRFGAEIITTKGKIFKFDDAHCILSFIKEGGTIHSELKDIYFVDFCGSHTLVNVNNAYFFKSQQLRSPMEGNIAAFCSRDSLNKIAGEFKNGVLKWNDIYAAE